MAQVLVKVFEQGDVINIKVFFCVNVWWYG